MRIELGDSVQSSDGQDAGKVDKLIVDPANGTVWSLIVRRGLVLREDIVVPLEAITDVADGLARLRYSAAEVESLHRITESELTAAPTDPPLAADQAAAGVMLPDSPTAPALTTPVPVPDIAPPVEAAPAIKAAPAEAVEALEDLDPPTAVVREGSDVIGRSGERIGEVRRIAVDTATRRPTDLVIRLGELFSQEIALPATSIARLGDGAVYLTVDKPDIEQTTTTVI
jgi:sporulation protein YlmC with PRC-barrel domain